MTRLARWFRRAGYTRQAARLLESAHALGHAPQLCSGWDERIPRVRELFACRTCGARGVIECAPARGPLVQYGCRTAQRGLFTESTKEIEHASDRC